MYNSLLSPFQWIHVDAGFYGNNGVFMEIFLKTRMKEIVFFFKLNICVDGPQGLILVFMLQVYKSMNLNLAAAVFICLTRNSASLKFRQFSPAILLREGI